MVKATYMYTRIGTRWMTWSISHSVLYFPGDFLVPCLGWVDLVGQVFIIAAIFAADIIHFEQPAPETHPLLFVILSSRRFYLNARLQVLQQQQVQVINKMAELTTSSLTCLAVICILTSSIAAAPAAVPQPNYTQVNYGVLLDAGSSSTKLKVYRWNQTSGSALVPQIDLLVNEKFDNGLGNYTDDDVGLVNYTNIIVARAKQGVPSHKQKSTPIYLMATAGLRYLSENDAVTFLEKTREVMANTTINPFVFKSSSITILSGEEEGVYTWIAANYLSGFFDNNRPENESIGIMEMGGGSTQIAFVPHGPIFSEEYQVIVAGRAYQLYVQSYLQFGSDAIRRRVVYELLQVSQTPNEVENPCMLREDSRRTLYDGRNVLEKGTGSPEECLKILRKILKPNTGVECSPKPCAIGRVHQPSVRDFKFFATQAFTYAPENLKVVGPDKILHIDQLKEAAILHCNRTKGQAVKESGMNPLSVSNDCLMGLYIPTLLTLSYKFSPSSTNIQLTSMIGNSSVDWALGAMLVELSNNFGSHKFNYAIRSAKGIQSAITPKGNNASTSLHSSQLLIFVFLISLAIILRDCVYFDVKV